MKHPFLIKESLAFGWKTMAEHLEYFLVVVIIGQVIAYIPQVAVNILAILIKSVDIKNTAVIVVSAFLIFALTIVGIIVTIIIDLGYKRITISFQDGITPSFRDFFIQKPRIVLRSIGGGLLLALAFCGIGVAILLVCLIAYLLLSLLNLDRQMLQIAFFTIGILGYAIIVGYLGVRFQFYNYLLVSGDTGVIDALHQSFVMTKGAVWKLSLFALLVVLINIAGLLVFIVGLLATIPMTLIAYARVYRILQQRLAGTPAPLAPPIIQS